MATIELNEAQVGIVLSIQIFDEFFIELHKNDPKLQTLSFGLFQFTISEIRFLLNSEATDTLLRVSGKLGDVDLTIDISLSLVLKTVDDNPPVLGLAYEGVKGIQGENIEALEDTIVSLIDGRFTDSSPGSIGARIDSIEIDLISSAVEGLEAIAFPEEADRPDRDSWNSSLRILAAENEDSMDAVAIFVAPPGSSADVTIASSFLNAKTGFGIIFNRSFLQDVLTRGAQESIGSKKCGATLEALNLTLESDRIALEGRVKKSLVNIPFKGPVFPFLYRGTTVMTMDASQVDADEPEGLSGFLKFLGILTAIILPFIGGVIFGLVGIIAGIVADVWVVPAVWGASEDLDHADETIQGGLGGALGGQLSALASGLIVEEEVEMITLESTPNELNLIDGHFLFDALTFVSPIEKEIVNGWYTAQHSRFVFFQLQGGQKFKTSELARLVKSGKITTPGFHAVQHSNGRLFMRADPDNEHANNLMQRFRMNPPDEPFPVFVEQDEEEDEC